MTRSRPTERNDEGSARTLEGDLPLRLTSAAHQTSHWNAWLCYLAFLVANLGSASAALLVANNRRDVSLVLLIVPFFAAQAVGCLSIGCLVDIRGRIKGLLYASAFTTVGLTLALLLLTSGTSILHGAMSQNGTFGFFRFGSVGYIVLATSLSIAGVGVGGMYPAAATTLAESVTAAKRPVHLAVMFCMQALAQVAVRLLAAIAYAFQPALPVASVFTWLCGLSLAAAAVVWGATWMLGGETEHFLRYYRRLRTGTVHRPGDGEDPHATLLLAPDTNEPEEPFYAVDHWDQYKRLLSPYTEAFMWDLVGSSVPWFIFDFCYYGDGAFHFLLVQRVRGLESDREENIYALVVAAIALLGYLSSPVLVRRMAPKLLQILGFVVLAFVYFGLGLSLYSIGHTAQVPGSISQYKGASLLYDCVARFFNFVPNLTLVLIPVDAFPTKVRRFAFVRGHVDSSVGRFTGWRQLLVASASSVRCFSHGHYLSQVSAVPRPLPSVLLQLFLAPSAHGH